MDSSLPIKRSHSESKESGPLNSASDETLQTASRDEHQEDDEMVRESLSLDVVWRGNERYPLRIPKYATVLSIKALLEELTGVDAESQKLLGL
ncbi:hypothetical protein GGI18_005166, partial [Coemansia linderi]